MDPIAIHADPLEPWFSPDDFDLVRSVHVGGPEYQPQWSTQSSSSFTALMTAPSRVASTTNHHSPSPPTPIYSGVATHSSPSPPRVSPSHKYPMPVDEPSMTVEELRREKNRQKVRRHYYRKLNHLNALRSEVAQLESTFQKLLHQNETPRALTAAPAVERNRLVDELAICRAALERENEQLRQLVNERQAYYAPLRELLATEDMLFMSTHMAKTIFIKPLRVPECASVRGKAVEDVLLLTNRPRRSFLGGAGIAGWQDHVTVENGLWKFSLYKTFRNVSPSAFCDRTWPLLTEPNAFSHMYSPAVEAKCVTVQRVDDCNVVLFQECRAMDANNEYILMKSLFLASRVATPTGELVVLRGLGEDRLQDRELFLPTSGEHAGQIVWHDAFTWVKFDRTGLYSEDCIVEFGGSAPTVGNNMSFWSVEIINLVVRWECAIHGTPLVLAPSDDNDETPQVRTPPVEVP